MKNRSCSKVGLRPRSAVLAGVLAVAGCDGVTSPEFTASAELLAGATSPARGSGSSAGGSCDGTLTGVSVENLEVREGATCVLDGTRVDGNVLVRRGATLDTRGARIRGNVQAEDAHSVVLGAETIVGGDVQVKRRALVRLVDMTVDGNVQVEERGASLESVGLTVGGDLQFKKADSAEIDDAHVRGNLQLEEGRGPLVVSLTYVAGNLQVVKNRGGVSLVDNRIEQSLQCDENDPAPIGGGNTAGEKEGQCRAL